MAPRAVPVRPSALAGAPRSGHPDWALLNKAGRISDDRNETTAECRTAEGQAVEVSFCLADPPAVSHFSVHCPGLEGDDYSDTQPLLICAEGPFVLFCVTLNVPERGSVHHFVYSARGPSSKRPSLHLLPEPDAQIQAFQAQQFGILPCGGGHFAVAFLDRVRPINCWRYHAYVFSSTTRAWSRTKPTMPPDLSQSDQVLLDRHRSCKQITVGASSLGWVDLLGGVLLLCNLFDKHPAIEYIPFPASRVPLADEDGVADIVAAAEHLCEDCCGHLISYIRRDLIKYIPFPASGVPLADEDGDADRAARHFCDGCCGMNYIPLLASRVPLADQDGVAGIAAEHLYDVSCCGDLIKFVQIDFDKPDYGSSGVAWKATTWNRKLSWCAWRDGHTVDVAEISVDTNRYSALLPELLNDETKQLELKNLIFINPTLSIQDDHLLYIRAKVKAQDDTSWVLALDMKHASLNALAPVSTQPFCGVSVTMYSPCAFPKYYLHNMPAEADMAKPVVRHVYVTADKRSRRRQQRILNPNSSRRNPVARAEQAGGHERASVLEFLLLHRRNINFFVFIVVPIMAKVLSYIYS
ncbi:hypothetical protein CFC21_045694 [Triticum aestivum]|uniref:DUF1618 domain-containing protein n=3 Tax=Triticinae TaxID=1648030 RepID=A0A9R1FT30_WHEAT|nr:uncharacterized protein LOC123073870 [Triticum aestivum]KAF7034713.1 hypothetical protein CFC21_045694 [Triticum aestivum]